MRSRKWYLFLLKLDFVFLFAFIAIVPNPLYWGQQVTRRLDHSRLITPQAPQVQALNESQNLWSFMSSRYGATPDDFYTWDTETRAYRTYRYIRSIIDYTYDIDNQHVFDYAATPSEVLERGRDDCQGISCLTVSLLIYLGIDAYVCECPFHWYIRVFPEGIANDTIYHDIYRSSNHEDPFYVFNHERSFFPEGIWWSISTALSYEYVASKFHEIVNGTLDLSVISNGLPETTIPEAITWLFLLGVSFLAAIPIMVFLRLPRFKKITKFSKIVNLCALAAMIFLGFTSITFLPFSVFLPFGIMVCSIGIFLVHSGLLDSVTTRFGKRTTVSKETPP